MERYKVNPVFFVMDGDGPWVRAEDAFVAEATNRELRTRNSNLDDECKRLKGNLEALKDDVRACHDARISANMKIQGLEREREDSRASERMSAAKHEAVLAQVKAAEGRVEELGRTVVQREIERDAARTQAAAAEARVKELERSLEEAINQRDLARSRHAYANGVITHVEQKNNRLGVKVLELEERARELESEVAWLREEASASSTFGVARRFQESGPKAEWGLRTYLWLEGRLERLAELEASVARTSMERITSISREHGWNGTDVLGNWLLSKLNERDEYRRHLDNIRNALREK